jgi:hypothetical protein
MFDLDNYCMNLVHEIETARHRVITDREIAQDSRLPTNGGFQPVVFVRAILAGVIARLAPKRKHLAS